jgi:NTE family protein
MLVNLVLSGSGIKFPFFVGAIVRLLEEDIQIAQVAGTSGGALVAAAIASGYSAEELSKLCLEIVPKLGSVAKPSIITFLDQMGFIKGNKIKEILEKHLVKKLGQAHLPLHITATNFDLGVIQIFSSVQQTDLDTARAVMSSMAAPLVFVPEIIDGDMFIDGGVAKNFPVDLFKASPHPTIGIYFVEKKKRYPRPRGLFKLFSYISRIISIMINSSATEDIQDAPSAKLLPIKSDIDSFDFNVSTEEVQRMIKSGYSQADKWIKSW